jgi:nicotinate phosphoribosyltransferase
MNDITSKPGGPLETEIARWTDHYFKRTRKVVERYGDKRVTYAVFMRRPVIFTPRIMVDWIERVGRERGATYDIEPRFVEGAWVGAGEPLLYISGQMSQLVELETLYLQKLGAACVAAYNAYSMCCDLPKAGFLAMDARHCAGTEMADMMAYAASVGSAAAKRDGRGRQVVVPPRHSWRPLCRGTRPGSLLCGARTPRGERRAAIPLR